MQNRTINVALSEEDIELIIDALDIYAGAVVEVDELVEYLSNV